MIPWKYIFFWGFTLSTVLQQIFDYASMLEERGVPKAALIYVQKEVSSFLSDETKAIDEELLTFPLHLYSSSTIVHFLTVTYYYKELLSHRAEFFEKVYNELVFVRGMKDAEEALLILQ